MTFEDDRAQIIRDELWAATPATDPGPRRLVRMTALLHMFREPGGPLVEVDDVARILTSKGVYVEARIASGPPRPPTRRDVVALSLAGPSPVSPGIEPVVAQQPHADEELWTRLQGQSPGSRTPWLDMGVGDESTGLVGSLLKSYDPLVARRIADARDGGAAAVILSDDPDAPRGLWFPAALALPAEDGRGGIEVVMPRMGFVVTPHWLATSWLPDVRDGDDTLLRSAVMSRVARRRSDGFAAGGAPDVSSAGEMALVALETLVDTYDRSTRDLDAELSRIESDLEADVGIAITALGRVLAATTRMRHALLGLRRARLESYDRSWFPNVSDDAGREGPGGRTADLLALVEARLDDLTDLQLTARSVLQVAEASQTAGRLRRSERLDDSVRLITAVILVPTLVAAVYGANVALPGGSSWVGTVAMLALMVAGGALGWFWLTFRK